MFGCFGGSKGAVLEPAERGAAVLGGVWRRGAAFSAVQARLRHVFGLCTGALFFFVGGSKGAVLDPPKVLYSVFCGA